MRRIIICSIMAMVILHWCIPLSGEITNMSENISPELKLGILWTSGDPAVAKKMVMIYAFNAKKQNWFKTVRLIIWGPSAKLAVEDTEIKEWITKLKIVGVEVTSCKWCADSYGVSEQLKKLGVKVIYYGKALSDMIKSGWKILSI